MRLHADVSRYFNLLCGFAGCDRDSEFLIGVFGKTQGWGASNTAVMHRALPQVTLMILLAGEM